jgi:hypothetical protein
MRRDLNDERVIATDRPQAAWELAKIVVTIAALMIFYSTLSGAQQTAPTDKQASSSASSPAKTVLQFPLEHGCESA